MSDVVLVFYFFWSIFIFRHHEKIIFSSLAALSFSKTNNNNISLSFRKYIQAEACQLTFSISIYTHLQLSQVLFLPVPTDQKHAFVPPLFSSSDVYVVLLRLLLLPAESKQETSKLQLRRRGTR